MIQSMSDIFQTTPNSGNMTIVFETTEVCG